MDYHEHPFDLEFLDLTGVEDQERKKVLGYLYSQDGVKLPRKYHTERLYNNYLQYHHTNQNVILQQTAPFPVHVTTNHINYVAPALVPQIYTPQGYIPIPCAYPGQGDQYYANKFKPACSAPQKTIVSVSSYFQANTANIETVPVVSVQKVPVNQPAQNVLPPTVPVPSSKAPVAAAHHQPPGKPTEATTINRVEASPAVNASSLTKQNGIEASATPPQNKSWASLFSRSDGKTKKGEEVVVANGIDKAEESATIVDVNDEELAAIKKKLGAKYDDPSFFRVGEFLSSHALDSRTISLQPRGLINRSNYCYINSILQALLACPPMYNLLSGIAKDISSDKEPIPMISGMSKLVREFHHLPAGQRVGRRMDKNQKKEQNHVSINCDTPFEPSWIYKMLSGKRSDSFVIEGRQEDAEEFLGCLLNGLNDEMLELIKLVSTSMPKAFNSDHDLNDGGREWQVMGPKNKGSITRRTEFNKTPISDIFGGLLRSRIHKTGEQDTDNIQPFFTLQLNIEEAASVKEALEALVSKNQLEGVTSSRTNEQVEAWQQVTIEELPVVLVLHLKCFDFKLDGCTKIMKALEFPVDLKIDNKLLSSKSTLSVKEKQYKLFAVVYHDGKEATKGHYVTDAYHVGYASWLRYDDASVKAVQEEHVLKPQGTRVPYLLFYRRSDSIKSK